MKIKNINVKPSMLAIVGVCTRAFNKYSEKREFVESDFVFDSWCRSLTLILSLSLVSFITC